MNRIKSTYLQKLSNVETVLPAVCQIVRTEIEDEALVVEVVVGAVEDNLIAFDVQTQFETVVRGDGEVEFVCWLGTFGK